MSSNRKKWFSGYYIMIIIICLLVGLFIWFSFQIALEDLDKKKEDTYKKKTAMRVSPRAFSKAIVKSIFAEAVRTRPRHQNKQT